MLMTIMIIDAGTLQEHQDHFTTCSFLYYFPSRVSYFLYISKSFAAWVFSISTNHTAIYPAACTNTTYISFLIFFLSIHRYISLLHRAQSQDAWTPARTPLLVYFLPLLNMYSPSSPSNQTKREIFLKGKSHWITFFIGQCADFPFFNNISPPGHSLLVSM